MRLSVFLSLIFLPPLTGCTGLALQDQSGTVQSHEVVKLSAAQAQQMAGDTVAFIQQHYPPAKSTLVYKPIPGALGQSLQQQLQQAGYALMDHPSEAKYPVVSYVLDAVGTLHYLSVNIDGLQINRVYRVLADGQLLSTGTSIKTPPPPDVIDRVLDSSTVVPAKVQSPAAVAKVANKPAKVLPLSQPVPLAAKQKPVLDRSYYQQRWQQQQATLATPPPPIPVVPSAKTDVQPPPIIDQQAADIAVLEQKIQQLEKQLATIPPVAAPAQQPVQLAIKSAVPVLLPASLKTRVQPVAVPVAARQREKVDMARLLNPAVNTVQPTERQASLSLPEPVMLPPPLTTDLENLPVAQYTVQVMAGTNMEDLVRHQTTLEQQGYTAHILPLNRRLHVLRVSVKPENATRVKRELAAVYADAYILRGS